MIFTKKINLKLAIIGITFMGLLIITNSVLMEFGLQKSVEFTYSTHYEETEKILNNKFELLKDLADTLAEDKKDGIICKTCNSILNIFNSCKCYICTYRYL